MTTEQRYLAVRGLQVELVRKPIKNLHLGVYPPNGRVRVAAPRTVSDDAVRLAVIGKLGWIRKQRARFEAQPRQTVREMVSGESHYFLGRRYRLRVLEGSGVAKVTRRATALELRVRPGTSQGQRERVLSEWYRDQLRALIAPLLARWQPIVGVRSTDWGIKRMKTKWGSCSISSGRIWLNLELAKKPVRCLEYILVHELVHMIERKHNERFRGLMDEAMPQWRSRRDELNHAPLRHENWAY